MKFRTCTWPDSPSPTIGQPVVEYLTRPELNARGWSDYLIRSALPEPCGLLGTSYYYRSDLVCQAEQTERVATVLARRAERARTEGIPLPVAPAPDTRPLVVSMSQVVARGWPADLVPQFMPQPDWMEPHRDTWVEPYYLAVRVQVVEASGEFREAMAPVLAERARKQAEREAEHARWMAEWNERRAREEAARERVRRLEQSFQTQYPNFTGHVRPFQRGWGGEVCVNGQVVTVNSAEFCSLARQVGDTGNLKAVVDWLVTHEEVGDRRFRAALRFLVAGDPSGWAAWCQAGGLVTTEADREWLRTQRERQRTRGQDVVSAQTDVTPSETPAPALAA
jgi:hypothetical protein